MFGAMTKGQLNKIVKSPSWQLIFIGVDDKVIKSNNFWKNGKLKGLLYLIL
jgi:hypothetical protein